MSARERPCKRRGEFSMKTFAPEATLGFECIGSRCGDNCCIGWEIDIDPRTAQLYQTLPGPFGERLRENIQWGDPPVFRLGAGERCPFLNSQNLCDVLLTLGERGLCDICDRHPRFRNEFPDRIETGLGLCCEEAARLILGNSQKARLTAVAPLSRESGPVVELELLDALREGRETAFLLVQDRTLPIGERAALLLLFSEEMQGWLDGVGEENPAVRYRDAGFIQQKRALFPHFRRSAGEKRMFLQALCRFYQSLEQLDSRWSGLLGQVCGAETPAGGAAAFWRDPARAVEYEQLLWTSLYRHWMNAVFDEDVRSRGKLAVTNFLLVCRLGMLRFWEEGHFSLSDQVELARRYAKEVEYSPENLEALADAAWEDPAFETEKLMALLWE